MTDSFDVIVIGAGPAGMAAACSAASNGARTLLLDENAGPGGQIYRAIAASPFRSGRILGQAYWVGENWINRLKRSGAEHRPRTTVWSLRAISDGVEIGTLGDGVAQILKARQAIVATGVMERPMPVPGWTLPGVMTVGAAQTLLKSSAMVPQGEAVLAGTGPLLYLFARQLIAAGAPPALVLDTTPRANRLRALAHLPSFIASRYFFKGIGLLAAVSRRVPVVRDVTSLAIEGAERAKSIRWRTDAGWQERGCDLVLLHQGVVPNIDLWSSAGCRAAWNDGQACWHAEIDSWGQSSEAGILVAGDGAGIGGAEVAAIRGVLAGLQTAHLCGGIDAGSRDLQARAAFQALARLLRGRDFIDAAFLAPRWSRIPEAETLVCRCEEATMGDLVAAMGDGASGLASLKTFSRCGMGPCQGRQCGLVVTEALAAALGRPPAEIGHFRSRPPVRPIPLGALAAIPATDEEIGSVVRL